MKELIVPAEMYRIVDLTTRLAVDARKRIEKQQQADQAKLAVEKTLPPLFESFEALLEKQPPLNWLVDGLLETPSTVLFFGPSGAGKSFVAVDLAAASTTGGEWYGDRRVASGVVFYIAGEGSRGLLRRFQAWQLARDVRIPVCRLFLSTQRIELDENGAAAVEKEIEQRAAECGVAPALVIVDTIARALPSGADENSAKDMGAFVNVIDGIRDRFRCVVVLVHHTGQSDNKRASNRARGSSALKAAMDAEMCVSQKGNVNQAEWTKLKDLPEEPVPLTFILESEDVGTDDAGKPITSAAVVWRGAAPKQPRLLTLTDTERLGLRTLRDTMHANGDRVDKETWRRAFVAGRPEGTSKANATAWGRAWEGLEGKKLIDLSGNFVILTEAGRRFNSVFEKTPQAPQCTSTAPPEVRGQAPHLTSPPLRGEVLRCPPEVARRKRKKGRQQ